MELQSGLKIVTHTGFQSTHILYIGAEGVVLCCHVSSLNPKAVL